MGELCPCRYDRFFQMRKMILYFRMIFTYDLQFGSLYRFVIEVFLHAFGRVFRLFDVKWYNFTDNPHLTSNSRLNKGLIKDLSYIETVVSEWLWFTFRNDRPHFQMIANDLPSQMTAKIWPAFSKAATAEKSAVAAEFFCLKNIFRKSAVFNLPNESPCYTFSLPMVKRVFFLKFDFAAPKQYR